MKLLRVNSNGAYDNITVRDGSVFLELAIQWQPVPLISNADTGVVFTWEDTSGGRLEEKMTITSGATATTLSGPVVPGQQVSVGPMLQAQDGSFVGFAWVGEDFSPPDTWVPYMVAFDQTGAVRWTVANEQPKIATEDGIVIGKSGITYDQNGSAIGQTNIATQSWTLNSYQGGGRLAQIASKPTLYEFSYAAFLSNSGTFVRARAMPQEALYKLANANLTATPQCDALLAQFANIGSVTKATLVAQLQATANRAREYVFDGPSSSVPLDPVKFLDSASPGVATVKQYFEAHSTFNDYVDGLSQFNGDAVFFRFKDWFSWLKGWGSKFQIISFNPLSLLKPGQVNYYGVGTVMHEILHKKTVGGGFIHQQMDVAIGAVGWPPPTVGHNSESDAIGKLCFGNLQ